MKVTTKGQVTIPQQIREQLGIYPGSEVDFAIEGDAIKVTQTQQRIVHGNALVEQMRGRGDVRMTTDEILALTRGES